MKHVNPETIIIKPTLKQIETLQLTIGKRLNN